MPSTRPIPDSLSTRLLVALLVCALVVGFGTAASASLAGPELVVEDDRGEVLLTAPVEEGAVVSLEYTHSVEKTAVADVYVVDGTDLRMIRMEFDSYGAGLPSEADVERAPDGEGYVYHLDRSYDRIEVSPGQRAGHELVVDGERYDLVSISDGRPVSIYVSDRSNPTTITDVI